MIERTSPHTITITIATTRLTKAVLICAAIFVLLTLLFPPYHYHEGRFETNLGYSFFLSPPIVTPAKRENDYIAYYATVNFSMLLMQWAGIVLISGLLLCIPKATQHKPS